MEYTELKGCHSGCDPVGLNGPDGIDMFYSYQAGKDDMITTIKAKIERLMDEYKPIVGLTGAHIVLAKLLSFLSDLEKSENPMNKDDAMKELDEKIALVKQRGTWDGVDVDKYMDEVRGREPEKPIPADLEEAADEMAIRAFPEKKSYSTVIDRVVDYNAVDRQNYRDGIIAGAKWQEKKDQETIKLAEDHAFLAGADWQREQMMKEADYDNIGVGKISEHIGDGNEVLKKFEFTDRKDIVGFQGDKGRWAVGDKVKVYIKKFEQVEFNKSE